MTHDSHRLALAALAARRRARRPRAARGARGITVKGSDTMVILAQRWAETYMSDAPRRDRPGHRRRLGHRHRRADQRHHRRLHVVAPDEGGREAQAARPLPDDGHRDPGRQGRALDLRPRVEPGEGALARAAARDLHRRDHELEAGRRRATRRSSLYGRENNSGTYVYFKDNVLHGRDYSPRCQTLPGTAAVVNAVAQDPNGIGYGGAAYAKGVRELAVEPDGGLARGAAERRDRARRQLPDHAQPVLLHAHASPRGTSRSSSTGCCRRTARQLATKVGYFQLD